jgi:hypothetical protein
MAAAPPMNLGAKSAHLNNTGAFLMQGKGASFDMEEDDETAATNYVGALQQFFGPSPKKIELDLGSMRSHEAYFLPDAYRGRSDFLRNTVVDLMTESRNNFLTSVILPMRHTDNPNMKWSSFKFDQTLVDFEPEQGVPRYVSVRSEQHAEYMQRRGIALYLNHGFANSDLGRLDYNLKLNAIACATQETMCQEGLLAMLDTKMVYKELAAKKHYREGASVAPSKIRTDSMQRWASVQKVDRGWHMLDAEINHQMHAESIYPDAWIVPPRMRHYAVLGQAAETEYFRAGPISRINQCRRRQIRR